MIDLFNTKRLAEMHKKYKIISSDYLKLVTTDCDLKIENNRLLHAVSKLTGEIDILKQRGNLCSKL